jgi:hypothetical protein
MLQAGFLSALVQSWFGTRAVSFFKVRFLDRVWVGDRLAAVGRLIPGPERQAEFLMVNQHGDDVIYATATAGLQS